MNKFLKAFYAFAILAVLPIAFAGCSKEIESVTVNWEGVDGNNVMYLDYGTDVDLNSACVDVLYKGDSTVYTYHYTDEGNPISVNLGDFDKTVSGSYEITVKFLNQPEITITAVVGSPFIIDRSAIPASVVYGSTIDWATVTATFCDENLQSHELTQGTDWTIDYSTYQANVPGTYTITCSYINNGQTYSQTFTVTVATLGSVAKYALDGDTLVLFNNCSYSFSTVTNLVLTDKSTGNPVELQNNTISGIDLGEYTLSYTKNDEQFSKNIRIVEYLSLFSAGENYLSYLTASNELGTTQSAYRGAEATPYYVGTANGFTFDISLVSALNSSAVVTASFDILNYTFYQKNGDNYEEVELTENEFNGTTLTLGERYLGAQMKVVITPKYQALDSITMYFEVNNGVNVYTDAEMKLAYANRNVSTINIHRNITAVLSAEQINDDNTPKNYAMEAATQYIVYNADGTLKNNYTANVYVRTGTTAETLNVNGNYFSISAVNLPLCTPKNNSTLYPDQKGDLSSAGGEGVVCCHTGIFFNDTGYDADISYNNLTILSNTGTFSAISEDDTITEEMVQEAKAKAGGFNGIQTISTDISLDNVVIRFTGIGVYYDYHASATVKDSIVEESWGNDIYSWGGSTLTLTNSYMGSAGGAAVWLYDRYPELNTETDLRNDPTLVMDNDSVIDNYVVGTECWFIAYGRAALASQIKVFMENGLGQMSNGYATILKTIDKGESFNFAVMLQNNDDGTRYLTDTTGQYIDNNGDYVYELSGTNYVDINGSIVYALNTADMYVNSTYQVAYIKSGETYVSPDEQNTASAEFDGSATVSYNGETYTLYTAGTVYVNTDKTLVAYKKVGDVFKTIAGNDIPTKVIDNANPFLLSNNRINFQIGDITVSRTNNDANGYLTDYRTILGGGTFMGAVSSKSNTAIFNPTLDAISNSFGAVYADSTGNTNMLDELRATLLVMANVATDPGRATIPDRTLLLNILSALKTQMDDVNMGDAEAIQTLSFLLVSAPSFQESNTKYLEVITSVLGLGNVTIITQFSPKS